MPTMTASDLVKRAKQVRENQSVWHQHWDDLARVMIPRLLGFSEQQVAGASRVDELFDGTPMRAARGLANAIAAMLRPDGEKWFFVKAEDDALNDDDEARVWLEDATERLRTALENPKARFRDTMGASDLALVVFGTGPYFIGESKNLSHLQFQNIHLKDAGIDWDEEADAYAFYRFRRYTARQAEERFGFANLGQATIDKLKANKVDERCEYIHAVLPRRDRMVKGVFSKNMPYASYWIEEESKHIVAEGGFHEFPFIIPRMETAPNEDYGRSPGMIALPDANTLQAMGETLLVAGQKAAEPPIMMPNDGSSQGANMFPGGITYYDVSIAKALGRNPIFPLEMGSKIPLTRDMQQDVREGVWASFFRNILNLPVSGPQMTAEEIRARKEEILREVGPMFGRLESNDTAPMIERSFSVMLRAKAFAPIPLVLANQNVKFEYESPVKRIRKQIEAAMARAWVADAIEISTATGRPDALDRVNIDEYLKVGHEAGKLPEKLMNDDDTVAAIRDQRAQQTEAANRMAMTREGVDIAKTGAEAMKSAGLVDEAA